MLSKTFCVMPWFNHEIYSAHTTSCCLLPKEHDIEQIKHDLLNDIKSTDCQKCWALESNNNESRRLQENRFLDWKLDRDIEKIEQDCRNHNNSTLMYQIETSNLCNQACITCGPDNSTKWQEIERNAGIKTSKFFAQNIDQLDINYKHAVKINFLGGEPTFDPRTFYIIEKLHEHNNTDCFISIVTNGYNEIPNKYKNLLKQFPNINICFSIDGIESRFEYMRWPAKWNNLQKVLDSYKNITNNFSVSYTISGVNCLYYEETVNWFEKQNLKYLHNIVESPDWCSLKRAPIAIKNQIRHIPFFKDVSKHNGKETDVNEFLKQLHHQDRLKFINLKDYMPELAGLLNL